MKPAQLGGMVGALLGLVLIFVYKLTVVSSPWLAAVLWPAHFFMTAFNGFGSFGHMMLDTLATFGNILIYAAIGYGIGLLIPSGGER